MLASCALAALGFTLPLPAAHHPPVLPRAMAQPQMMFGGGGGAKEDDGGGFM